MRALYGMLVALVAGAAVAAPLNPVGWVTPELSFATPGTSDIELELAQMQYQRVDNRVEAHFEVWTSKFRKGNGRGKVYIKHNIPEPHAQGLYGYMFKWKGVIFPPRYTYIGVHTDAERIYFWLSGSSVDPIPLTTDHFRDGQRVELMGTAAWWTEYE
jgi:hypothetical protein